MTSFYDLKPAAPPAKAEKPAEEKKWYPGLHDPSVIYQEEFTEYLPRLGDQGLTVAEQEQARRTLTLGAEELHQSNGVEKQKVLRLVLEERVSPATPEQQAAWDVQSRKALREKYGAVQAEKVVDQVQKLLKKNPQLQALVKNAGAVASHPDFILALARRVQMEWQG